MGGRGRTCLPASLKSERVWVEARIIFPPPNVRHRLFCLSYVRKRANPCRASIFYVTIFIIGKSQDIQETAFDALSAPALRMESRHFRSLFWFSIFGFPARMGCGQDAHTRRRLPD